MRTKKMQQILLVTRRAVPLPYSKIKMKMLTKSRHNPYFSSSSSSPSTPFLYSILTKMPMIIPILFQWIHMLVEPPPAFISFELKNTFTKVGLVYDLQQDVPDGAYISFPLFMFGKPSATKYFKDADSFILLWTQLSRKSNIMRKCGLPC